MTPRAFIVRPAVFAPAVLSVVFVALAIQSSWWLLAALPFVWLGSTCARPNLNLADGCLAYASIVVGFAMMAAFRPLGIAVVAGAVSGLFASAIEKHVRMRPVPDA